MTVFSGFFNSNQNHDRMYNASDFGKFFDGLISDGVYVNFPEDESDPTDKAFYVKPGSSGLTVSVAKGRAWFLSTYTYNDATITITLDPVTNNLQSRIDAIVIDVNTGDAARENTITVVKGIQGTSPDRPSLISQATHKQYPIAFVTVVGGATSISETNIVQTVGTTDPDAIPAVEALLEYSSRTKAELEQQIAAKTFPNLANTLATENTEIDSDNDYLISQKVSNNTAGAYVRKTWGMVVSWLRKKISAEKGLVYDSATGKIKMALRSETKLDNNSAKATEVQGRVYPVELDKSGYPSVNVPWTDNNTNNAVTQTPSSDNKNYELLMSYTNDNTLRTEGTRKSSDLLYNPSTKTLSVPNLNPTNPLPVSKGGTGKLSFTSNTVLVGNGTGTPSERTIDTTSGGTSGSEALITSGAVNSKVTEMQTTFQAGVDAVYNACVAQGVTPSASTPEAIATAIGNLRKTPYTETYKPTERKSNNDMGIPHNKRYVDTTAVPNSNSGTYTFPANDTGGTKDLGSTNSYRYVNAGNVYSKGSSDGWNSGYSIGVSTGHSDQRTFPYELHARYDNTLNHIYVSFMQNGTNIWIGDTTGKQIDLGRTGDVSYDGALQLR